MDDSALGLCGVYLHQKAVKSIDFLFEMLKNSSLRQSLFFETGYSVTILSVAAGCLLIGLMVPVENIFTRDLLYALTTTNGDIIRLTLLA